MKELIQLKSKDLPLLRVKLYKEQNGICAICNEELDERNHIDHQHATTKETIGKNGAGLVRGLVCASCNTFEGKIWNASKRFGKFDNKIEWLKSLIKYYEKEPLPYIHPTEAPKIKKLQKSSYNKLKKVYELKSKFPEYPRSGKITKKLEELFNKYNLTPEFYS